MHTYILVRKMRNETKIRHVIKIPALAFSRRSSFWKYKVYDDKGNVLYKGYCSKRPKIIEVETELSRLPTYIIRFETSNRGHRSVTIYEIVSNLQIMKRDTIKDTDNEQVIEDVLNKLPKTIQEEIINWLWR